MKKKGFTLIEIIITIALLGLIGSVIAINMVGLTKKQQEKENKRLASIIETAASGYIKDENIDVSKGNCVDVETLVEKNWLKESDVKDKLNYHVEVTEEDNEKRYELKEKTCDGIGKKPTLDEEKIYITYNANGGKYSDGTKTKSIESTTIITDTPSKDGYKFLGWSKNSTSKTAQYKRGDTISTKKNITLYAVYQTNKDTTTKYQLKVTVTNGTINNSPSKIYQLEANGSQTVEATPNPGYSKMNVTCGNGITRTTNGNKVTFKNITKDASCNITFEPYMVRVNYKYNEAPFNEDGTQQDTKIPSPKYKDFILENNTLNIGIQDNMYSEITCEGLDGSIKYRYSYQSGQLEFEEKKSAICDLTYTYIKHTFNFCNDYSNGKCNLYHSEPWYGIQGGMGNYTFGAFSTYDTIGKDKSGRYNDSSRLKNITAYIYDPKNFVMDLTVDVPEEFTDCDDCIVIYAYMPEVYSNLNYSDPYSYGMQNWMGNIDTETYSIKFMNNSIEDLKKTAETFISYYTYKAGALSPQPGAENLPDPPRYDEDGDWIQN